ncbi:hypothetical protein D9611_014451 [Ephemerocybe angulata]|uniref:F-box domain-containing protein n=1 Tax=Ephemerocybe angulata TaxID=980116 RepID=A0A8H5ERH6_9AGAR|nr:hypothetical protein D9611_014451 [Tulosesus angulatus]
MPVSFAGLWARLPTELKLLVFGCLSLQDAVSFSYVSLPFRLFALHCLRQRLSELLDPYRLDIYATFLALDRCDSVIAGSAALEIVSPSSIVPNNIDFMCPITGTDLFLSFLNHEKYQVFTDPFFGPRSIDDDPGQNAIKTAVTLYRQVDFSTVHVIVSSSSSALAPPFLSHSTFMMNFVSASGFYCCYPVLTGNKEGKSCTSSSFKPLPS